MDLLWILLYLDSPLPQRSELKFTKNTPYLTLTGYGVSVVRNFDKIDSVILDKIDVITALTCIMKKLSRICSRPVGNNTKIQHVSHLFMYFLLQPCLTHWGWDKRHFDISPMTFSNAFSWMKIYEFRSIFPWSLFPRDECTVFQHWFR